MEKLKSRKERFEYTGKLEEYQLIAQRKPYTEYEVDRYNGYQNYLYKRALYGLSALTEDELARTCSKKRKRIYKVYLKGQSVINEYKQKLTIAYSNFILQQLFPKSPMTDFFMNNTEVDLNFKNTLTFKDLNIQKDDIIQLFIENGVLPKNFMALSYQNDLPRLRNSKS